MRAFASGELLPEPVSKPFIDVKVQRYIVAVTFEQCQAIRDTPSANVMRQSVTCFCLQEDAALLNLSNNLPSTCSNREPTMGFEPMTC